MLRQFSIGSYHYIRAHLLFLKGILSKSKEFMDSKRRSFPRFYFMSAQDLLDVLSNGNQPEKVVPQFPKFFICLEDYTLEFLDGSPRPTAMGMNACVGTFLLRKVDFNL